MRNRALWFIVGAKEQHVPSHPILPDSRKAAVEAVLEEVLAEVRAVSDATLLHECRSIFRSKVPLNLRAYVAAAMALRLTGSASRQDRPKGRGSDKARGPEQAAADRTGGADKAKGRAPDKAREEPRQAREEKPGRRAEAARPERAPDKPAIEKQESKRGDEPEAREIRYRGEGVTLFVSAGRRQRFYARVAVRILTEAPGIGPEQVGDVRTMDNYCFIVVAPEAEEAAIAALNGLDFKGRILAANRARKKGEPAPTEATGSAPGTDYAAEPSRYDEGDAASSGDDASSGDYAADGAVNASDEGDDAAGADAFGQGSPEVADPEDMAEGDADGSADGSEERQG